MSNPKASMVEITPFSLIFQKGEEWRVEGETPTEYYITGRNDPTLFDVLIKDELSKLVKSGKLKIREEIIDFLDMSVMTVAKRRRTALSMMWVSVMKEALQIGLVEDMTQKSCKLVIEVKGPEVIDRYRNYHGETDYAEPKPGRKLHHGSLSENRTKQYLDIDEKRILLTPRSLWDLMKRWEANPVPETLVPQWTKNCGGGKALDQRTWAIVKESSVAYAGESYRTYDGVLRFINAEIVSRNALVAESNQIPLATPYMVRKAIDELPEFAKMFTRRGPKTTNNALRLVGRGPKFTRPGEEIVLDGWEAHVHTLLEPKVQRMFSLDVNTVRLRIVPAMDHATGYIFGLTAAPTGETAALTTKCLRMIGTDRSALARAAGCKSDWGPPIGVEILAQDSGSALWNEIYMQAGWVIANSVDHKAAGLAWLRGAVERVLQTIDTKFVQNFIARTGSNILSRHENDPQKRAAIVSDFFMRLFVRFIVDVYHHEPRLKGRAKRPSPARELEMALKVQPKAAPNPDVQRLAFGKVLDRKLTRAGLRFMNIEYSSVWLAKPLRDRGPHMMKIKVDPMNLGRISANIDNRWVTIPGPPELADVDLQTWIELGDRKAREVGEHAEIDFRTFVAPALLEIDAAARRAERHLGFADLDWTPAMMEKAEGMLRTYVVYDRAPIGAEPGVSGSSRELGTVITRTASHAAQISSSIAPAEPVSSKPTKRAEIQPTPDETPTALPVAPVRRIPRSRR